MEAVTYRWYGHVDWREDIDVGVKRSADDLADWRRRDPIARLVDGLREQGLFDEQSLLVMEAEVAAEVADAWQRAQDDPYPAPDATISRVFADLGATQ